MSSFSSFSAQTSFSKEQIITLVKEVKRAFELLDAIAEERLTDEEALLAETMTENLLASLGVLNEPELFDNIDIQTVLEETKLVCNYVDEFHELIQSTERPDFY